MIRSPATSSSWTIRRTRTFWKAWRRTAPKELVKANEKVGKKGNVMVRLVDKQNQDDVPPEPAFRSFSGAGTSLGSRASSSSAAASPPTRVVISALGKFVGPTSNQRLEGMRPPPPPQF